MTRTIAALTLLVGCELAQDGTEIGDEGPALCVGDEGVEISDPAETIGTLGAAPDALADGAEGAWAGPGATLSLGLDRAGFTYSDLQPATWEDDTPPPEGWDEVECFDVLWVPAQWALSVPGISVDWVGDVRWSEDGTILGGVQALLADNPAAADPGDEGGTDTGPPPELGELIVEPSAEPSTFVVDDMRRVELWVGGRFDGTGWDLELTWVAETHPQGPDANVSTLEEPVWSGRLEASD